jgi:hypothetical protein
VPATKRNDRQWAPEASHVPAVVDGESEQTAQLPHDQLWRAVIPRQRVVPADGQRKPKKVAGTFRRKVPATFFDRPVFWRSNRSRLVRRRKKVPATLRAKVPATLIGPAEVDEDGKNLQYKE